MESDEEDNFDEDGFTPTPTPDTPLSEARLWLEENVADGITCPLCHQHAQCYRRKLNKTMVRALQLMYLAGGAEQFVHGPTVLRGSPVFGGEMGKIAYFGLAQEETQRRKDGGRSGWWMLTEKGIAFLYGECRVQKYAIVYDGEVLGFEGKLVGIGDVAPEFRFDELMAGI